MIRAGWSEIVSLNDLSADSPNSYSSDFADHKALDSVWPQEDSRWASSMHLRTVWEEGSLSHPLGETPPAGPTPEATFQETSCCEVSPGHLFTFSVSGVNKKAWAELPASIFTLEAPCRRRSFKDWGNFKYLSSQCFPGGTVGKEPNCQCRQDKGCRFHPWVGKTPWRRKWQRTPVFLPGKSHGQKSLAGYSQRGREGWTRLGMPAQVNSMHLCQSGISWGKCLRLFMRSKSRVPSL